MVKRAMMRTINMMTMKIICKTMKMMMMTMTTMKTIAMMATITMTIKVTKNMAMMMMINEKLMATITQVWVVPLLNRNPWNSRLFQRMLEEVGHIVT